jgi:hypothetical protein
MREEAAARGKEWRRDGTHVEVEQGAAVWHVAGEGGKQRVRAKKAGLKGVEEGRGGGWKGVGEGGGGGGAQWRGNT